MCQLRKKGHPATRKLADVRLKQNQLKVDSDHVIVAD
jgi:hypothetical protein